ncbi:MAG TPA: HlyD family efflux transporter periplasmic adaptor subunit [Terriglobales bacterium]|nr:HlyD family efflux transporter periplasmic adaptor subunit [Terriglobales bacterium]
MKKKYAVIIASIAFVLTLSLTMYSLRDRSPKGAAAPAQTQAHDSLVAGPGRVEPLSEDIKLGSELSGKLRSVNVEEGDPVRKGQILAVLENDDYLAEVKSAAAQVDAKEATLRKVVNGARRQERSQALSSVHEAEAVMNNAKAEAERYEKLWASGVTSREEMERYRREYDVAQAQYKEAVEHHSLVDDRAREEDIAFAQADLELAKASLANAQARYEKTLIKSPIDGVVLRKHHRSGESVSNSSTVPDPILTVGDTKVIRVRMDVDETDVNKVHVGQKAYVTADAFGKQKFWGHVVRVGELLGPKNVRTDEPTERVDMKILETLVELDPGAQLPMGLRVDAYIVGGASEVAEGRAP